MWSSYLSLLLLVSISTHAALSEPVKSPSNLLTFAIPMVICPLLPTIASSPSTNCVVFFFFPFLSVVFGGWSERHPGTVYNQGEGDEQAPSTGNAASSSSSRSNATGGGAGASSIQDESSKVPLPRLELFAALAKLIKPVPSKEDLLKRFTDLCAQRQKRAKESQATLTPDADSPSSEVDGKKVLHSYESLFCNRCLMYDCSVHRFHPYANPDRAGGSGSVDAKLREDIYPSKPCGGGCFLKPEPKSKCTPAGRNAASGGTGAGRGAGGAALVGLCNKGHVLEQFSTRANVATIVSRRVCSACPKAATFSLAEGWCCPSCSDFVLCDLCAARDPCALAMSGFREQLAADRPLPSKSVGTAAAGRATTKRNLQERAAQYLSPALKAALAELPSQQWSLAESSFYEKASKIFEPTHFCAIAAYIGSKSCRAVRDYAVKSGTLSSPQKYAPSAVHTAAAASAAGGGSSSGGTGAGAADGGSGGVAGSDNESVGGTGTLGAKRKRQAKGKSAKGNSKKKHNARPFQKKDMRPEDSEMGETEHASYAPCDCKDACGPDCTCVSSNNWCEKFCQCGVGCRNRYSGCNCSAGCDTKSCPCFIANHECDPDICRCDCGCDGDKQATELHQLKRLKYTGRCTNVALQQGQGKRLLMGPSDVAGWGLFVRDGASKGEYLGEYRGEVISQEEADRRGLLFDKRKCSYLFNLNQDLVIDAMWKGNKLRFANHSDEGANCTTKVMMTNGDSRIGLYAMCDIEPGSELFFDYRYKTADKEASEPPPLPPTTSFFVNARTLMGCTGPLRRARRTPTVSHPCPLGSVSSYPMYADVCALR